jgi:hypothetical protein
MILGLLLSLMMSLELTLRCNLCRNAFLGRLGALFRILLLTFRSNDLCQNAFLGRLGALTLLQLKYELNTNFHSTPTVVIMEACTPVIIEASSRLTTEGGCICAARSGLSLP